MPKEAYDEWFKHSWVQDGVRVGPALFTLESLNLLTAAMEAECLLMNYIVNEHFPRGSDCDAVKEILREAMRKVGAWQPRGETQ